MAARCRPRKLLARLGAPPRPSVVTP